MEKETFIKEVEESTIDNNCYSLTEFAKYLTENFSKVSKAPFAPYEAREFAKRGKLPNKYGGNKLEYIEVKNTGIKFVKLIIE